MSQVKVNSQKMREGCESPLGGMSNKSMGDQSKKEEAREMPHAKPPKNVSLP